MKDSIRQKLVDDNRKSTRFIKYRVCCNVKGLERHAILQINSEPVGEQLREGMQISVECVNVINRCGEETLSAGKRTRIEKIEKLNDISVSLKIFIKLIQNCV